MAAGFLRKVVGAMGQKMEVRVLDSDGCKLNSPHSSYCIFCESYSAGHVFSWTQLEWYVNLTRNGLVRLVNLGAPDGFYR